MNNSVTILEVDLRIIDKVKRDAKEKDLVPISYKINFDGDKETWFIDVECYALLDGELMLPTLTAKYTYADKELRMRLFQNDLPFLQEQQHEMA